VAFLIAYANQTLGWENVVLFGSSQGGASSILGLHLLHKQYENKEAPHVSCVLVENAFAQKDLVWLRAIQTVMAGSKIGTSDVTENSAFIKLMRDYGRLLLPDAFFELVIRMVYFNLGFAGESLEPVTAVSEMAEQQFLFLHGTADSVVAPEHSQMLFDATKSLQKELKWFPGGHHAILPSQFPEDYQEITNKFLDGCHLE
jgi:fermentation-respiration switch protein FrsA (DUF1100 family)